MTEIELDVDDAQFVPPRRASTVVGEDWSRPTPLTLWRRIRLAFERPYTESWLKLTSTFLLGVVMGVAFALIIGGKFA